MDEDLEYLVKQFSTEGEATKALNVAAEKGWKIALLTADDRRLWAVFTRPRREKSDQASAGPSLRRGADLSGKTEPAAAASEFE